MLNSRMEDYYDVWALCREFEFDGEILSRAVAATFRRRKSDLPGTVPMGLSEEFLSDSTKLTNSIAFVLLTSTPLFALRHLIVAVPAFLSLPEVNACTSSGTCPPASCSKNG